VANQLAYRDLVQPHSIRKVRSGHPLGRCRGYLKALAGQNPFGRASTKGSQLVNLNPYAGAISQVQFVEPAAIRIDHAPGGQPIEVRGARGGAVRDRLNRELRRARPRSRGLRACG
jgi:hypothetical protein